jgi:leader peptidase (prepilin peptidase)/N-methyltransferase
MTAPLLTTAALFGAVIDSFLNVVIHRLPRGESLVAPGSRCTGCSAAIAPYDNVPVISWLVLRGRCRRCAVAIPVRYPLVEAATAAAFAAVALARGPSVELVALLPFAGVLIAVAAIDLDHRVVPNRILLPAAVWALTAAVLLRPDALPELLIAGAASFLALLLAAVAYPGGMGMGDVKLAGLMGLYLGLSVVPALLIAFFAGSAYGIAKIVREGPRARKAAVPFAPFLALGGIAAVIAGPELVQFYAERFL